jgi:hypothetical protein
VSAIGHVAHSRANALATQRSPALDTNTVRPRTLILMLGALLLATGLLILIVPKQVQTGHPVGAQVDPDAPTGEFSCGSALQYGFGNRPWEEDNPDTYRNNVFVPVSEVCTEQLQSNLRSGLFWVAAGGGVLLIRYIMIRRSRRVSPRTPSAR